MKQGIYTRKKGIRYETEHLSKIDSASVVVVILESGAEIELTVEKGMLKLWNRNPHNKRLIIQSTGATNVVEVGVRNLLLEGQVRELQAKLDLIEGILEG